MYTATWLKIVNRDLIHKGLQALLQKRRSAQSGGLSTLDIEKVVVSIGVDATQGSGSGLVKSVVKKGQKSKQASGGKAVRSAQAKSNLSVGGLSADKLAGGGNALTAALSMMALITGQRPYVTRAHKSIAAWQLREGQAVGCKTTLRGVNQWEFLDKTLKVALWRSQSHVGVAAGSITASEKAYSLTVGIPDINIYPETDTDNTYIYDPAHGSERIAKASVLNTSSARQSTQELLHSPCLSSVGRVLASGGSKQAVMSLLPSDNEGSDTTQDNQRNQTTRKTSTKSGSSAHAHTFSVNRRSAFGLQFTIVVSSNKHKTSLSAERKAALPSHPGIPVIAAQARTEAQSHALSSTASKKANGLASLAVAVYLSGFDLVVAA